MTTLRHIQTNVSSSPKNGWGYWAEVIEFTAKPEIETCGAVG